MIKIEIVCEEEGSFRIDPVGEILITSGTGRIWEKNVYLDSWLYVLITGLRHVEGGESASIDLVEEPDPLVFEPQNRGVKITYRDSSVAVDSIDEFRRALRSAILDFLRMFDVADRDNESELVNSIRKFSES